MVSSTMLRQNSLHENSKTRIASMFFFPNLSVKYQLHFIPLDVEENRQIAMLKAMWFSSAILLVFITCLYAVFEEFLVERLPRKGETPHKCVHCFYNLSRSF